MITGNKGEWSEIYVLLKLLAEGKLYAADEELNRIEDTYFPIIKIIRQESKEHINEYKTGEKVKIYVDGVEKISMDALVFDDEAEHLLGELMSSKKKSAFEVERTEHFMNSIECYKVSAPSTHKADILMQIHDTNTGIMPEVGFSIKSELGNPPTLLNAGKTTNFTYEIISHRDGIVSDTNSIYRVVNGKDHVDVKKRIANLIKDNGSLEYYDMDNEVFKNNLILIDSCMDNIIAQTLLYFYRDGITNCKDMVKRLEEENPLKYGNINAYAYKFKKFLASVALGMKPATEWNGIDEANGGYIIVTKEGDVVAYHIYNRNCFEEYLLNNTKYETASTSRHGFGEAYTEGYKQFIKLNLQIRFIK